MTPYGPVVHGEHFNPTIFESFRIFNAIIGTLLAEPVAVPVFLFMSGYLFFRGGNLSASEYKRKIISRSKTLLIPYFVWNGLLVIKLCIQSLPFFHWENTLNLTPKAIIAAFWIYRNELVNYAHPLDIDPADFIAPIMGPLWYLRNMFFLCLSSPFILWLINRFGRFLAIFSSILWVLSTICIKEVWVSIMIESLVFFSWGATLSIKGKSMTETITINKKRWYLGTIVLASIIIIMRLCGGNDYDNLMKMGLSFLILPRLISISDSLTACGCKAPQTLIASSLFIYIAHMLIAPMVQKTVLTITLHLLNNVSIVPLYLLMIGITVEIFLIAFEVLKKCLLSYRC